MTDYRQITNYSMNMPSIVIGIDVGDTIPAFTWNNNKIPSIAQPYYNNPVMNLRVQYTVFCC